MGFEQKKMRAILLAGAPITDYDCILKMIRSDDFIACADSGLTHAAKMGLHVSLAVGDFDSFSGKVNADEIITLPCKKDDTDAMALARLLVVRGFDEVLMLGCSGARLDHTLGAISVLLYLREQGIRVSMSDERHTVYAVMNESVCHPIGVGNTFSLLPFACGRAEGVSVNGAEYALENAVITADYPIGVSNVATDEKVKISVKKGTLLLITAKD